MLLCRLFLRTSCFLQNRICRLFWRLCSHLFWRSLRLLWNHYHLWFHTRFFLHLLWSRNETCYQIISHIAFDHFLFLLWSATLFLSSIRTIRIRTRLRWWTTTLCCRSQNIMLLRYRHTETTRLCLYTLTRQTQPFHHVRKWYRLLSILRITVFHHVWLHTLLDVAVCWNSWPILVWLVLARFAIDSTSLHAHRALRVKSMIQPKTVTEIATERCSCPRDHHCWNITRLFRWFWWFYRFWLIHCHPLQPKFSDRLIAIKTIHGTQSTHHRDREICRNHRQRFFCWHVQHDPRIKHFHTRFCWLSVWKHLLFLVIKLLMKLVIKLVWKFLMKLVFLTSFCVRWLFVLPLYHFFSFQFFFHLTHFSLYFLFL